MLVNLEKAAQYICQQQCSGETCGHYNKMTHVVRVCWAQTATTDFPWSYTCSVSSYVQTQEVAWIRHKGVSPQQLCMCLPGPWRHPQPCLSLPIPRGLLPCPQLRTPFELPRAISLCSSNATAGPIYSSPAGLAQPELRETGISQGSTETVVTCLSVPQEMKRKLRRHTFLSPFLFLAISGMCKERTDF